MEEKVGLIRLPSPTDTAWRESCEWSSAGTSWTAKGSGKAHSLTTTGEAIGRFCANPHHNQCAITETDRHGECATSSHTPFAIDRGTAYRPDFDRRRPSRFAARDSEIVSIHLSNQSQAGVLEKFIEIANTKPHPLDDHAIRDLAILMMSTPNYQVC
jgi:hypothetical protein